MVSSDNGEPFLKPFFSRPSGTHDDLHAYPAINRWAIFQLSLQDKRIGDKRIGHQRIAGYTSRLPSREGRIAVDFFVGR